MARPKGSENKDKPFREALRMELAAFGENDPRGLRGLARKLLASAAEGDNTLAAIKEVADRLDGKPAQESTVDITTVKYVARVPEKAKSVGEWQEQHLPQNTIQ